MKQIIISLNRVEIHTVERTRYFEHRKAFYSQEKFKARARVCFGIFLTGINRFLKASFLNRTPKEKLANEAAAGGEGPPHTPALGATPSPGPAAGKPEEAI